MRSGPSDYRRRSRSPQAATREGVRRAIRAYWSVRGGRIWKRRFKSVCLTFLEWFIYLVQSVINFGGNSPAIQNRLRVAQERHAAIIAGYLPRRDEPLIQEASEADLSDLDSEVGEAYVIYSSDEEGTEPVGVWSEYLPTLSQPVEPDHPPPFHLQHPWRRVPQPPDHPPPRVPRPPDHSPPSSSASTGHRNLANVIVSSNNPLLRRSQFKDLPNFIVEHRCLSEAQKQPIKYPYTQISKNGLFVLTTIKYLIEYEVAATDQTYSW